MIIPFTGSFVSPIEHKFGFAPDVDMGAGVPADVWDGPTQLYPFPAAAAATDVRSSDAADTLAGTGVQQVVVEGLDKDLKEVWQLVDMNGVTPVALDVDLLRCNRIYSFRGGSGETNAGTVTVQQGATVIGQISIDRGQSLQAVYTAPIDIISQRLVAYQVSVGRIAAAFVELTGMFKLPGSSIWRTFEIHTVHSQGTSEFDRQFPHAVPLAGLDIVPGTDIKIQVTDTSANDVSVAASFDIERSHRRTA